MKKNSNIELLLLVVILAIAAGAYRFGYTHFTDKADALKVQNKQLEARIAELNGKIESKTIYESGIALSKESISNILAKYGPGNTPEKSTMFVVDLEKEANMTISSISFNGNEVIYSSEDLDENGAPAIEATKTQLSISYQTDYDGLKKAVDYINKYPERMNIDNFSASFDSETGQLSGAMVINLYAVKGNGKEYKEPAVNGIKIGNDNIFGTVTPADGR